MYQGGKARIAKPIAEILRREAGPGRTYVEPFLGSAAVFHRVAPEFPAAIGADAMPDVALLWQAAARGWEPPEDLTEEHYRALRPAAPSAIRAFAGFPCSFGGKWFGGYARDPKSDRNYARAASRSIVSRAAGLRGAHILHADYRELAPYATADTVVYCDPPYAETLAYAGAGTFDSAAFWAEMTEWAHRGARVFVSEYQAPAGWTSVWSTERHTSTALDNRGKRAVDHLFVRAVN